MCHLDSNTLNLWNSFFNYNFNLNISGNTYDDIFNNYLISNNENANYEYLDSICFIEKLLNKEYSIMFFSISEKKINTININSRSKRKFYNLLSDFSIIITKNFPLDKDSLSSNKIILRHEIIKKCFNF